MDTIKEIKTREQLIKTALILSVITILYNIAEGAVSTFFGYKDDTIALFGFGVDSFVEVISGAGILHMVLRISVNPPASRDRFERQALRITGISFYVLTAGLLAGAVLNILYQTKPETTIAGGVISLVSIATMWLLYYIKLKTGRDLGSQPIIADANCTKTCLYLSFVLLFSSIFFELFKIGYIDAAGALGIAYFAFREGRESMEKSRNDGFSCSCGDKNC